MCPEDMMRMCWTRINQNLHWFICMNTSCENWMERVKEFPTLWSECNACWMDCWSDETFIAAGKRILQTKDMEMIKSCLHIHQTMENFTKEHMNCSCSSAYFIECMEVCKQLCCKKEETYEAEIQKMWINQQKVCEALEAVMMMKNQMKNMNVHCDHEKMKKCEDLIEHFMNMKKMMENCMCTTKCEMKNMCGMNMMKAAMIVYGGMLNCEERESMKKNWRAKLSYNGVFFDDKIMMMDECMMNEVDMMMEENMWILSNCKRVPLYIDPQHEMTNMMKNYLQRKGEGVCVLNENTRDLMNCIRREVLCGKWVIVEEIKECQKFMIEQIMQMKDRKVILCTHNYHMNVPHTVCKVNCCITPKRAEHMLLSCLMDYECPKLWKNMKDMWCNIEKMNKNIMETMNVKIVKILSCCTGNILDDSELMNVLCCLHKMNQEMVTIKEKW